MDLISPVMPDPDVRPAIRREAVLVGCLVGDLPGFRTRRVESLTLGLEGIAGDGHAGFTRLAGGREPWYPRGTEIRSGRQISIVSEEELAEAADRLGIAAVDPAAIGANLVLAGLPRLSYLPAGTRLFFEGGATAVVEATNAPCRHAGAALAAEVGRPEVEPGFVKAAKRRRGVVASVERPGSVRSGSAVSVRIPEQWIYEP